MRFRALFAFGLFVVIGSAAFGQTAGMVTFQGLIRSTATGNPPITTPVSLEFRIFNADTGGTQVDMDGDGTLEATAAAPGAGTDTILVGPLTPNGGIVSTKFGPVSPKAFAACTPGVPGCRWLEVTVVGSAIPLSRLEMVSPPGAAEQVNVLQSGNEAIITSATGNVGIGTSSPATKLHVAGSVRVDSSLGIGTPAGGARPLAIIKNVPGAQLMSIQNLSSDPLGRCGFVTENDVGATGTLEVLSSTYGTGFSSRVVLRSLDPTPGLDLAATGTLGEIRFFTGSYPFSPASQRMCIIPNGNVGIGVSNPGARLHVESSHPSDAVASIRATSGSFVGDVLSVFGFPNSSAYNAFVVRDSANNTKLVVKGSGNVGIGTSTPAHKLTVAGNISTTEAGQRIQARYSDGTDDYASSLAWTSGIGGIVTLGQNGRNEIRAGKNATGGALAIIVNNTAEPFQTHNGIDALYINAAGNVGIGTVTPGAKLDVAGNMFVSGVPCCASDAQFKKNIVNVGSALGRLLSLRGVWFNWKDPAKHGDEARRQMGMIAQEVEKVLPEWVLTDKEGYRYLNTNGFPALAVEAIREMKDENDTLTARVSSLEKELAHLKSLEKELADLKLAVIKLNGNSAKAGNP